MLQSGGTRQLMTMSILAFLVLGFIGLVHASNQTIPSNNTTTSFRRFFPEYNDAFQLILRENCSEIVEWYHQNELRDEDDETPASNQILRARK